MFLNYIAGAVSLVLAISAFLPWVTFWWFYSLKGIESIYGIGILLTGLLGIAVAAFQNLSGRLRGQAFIFLSLAAMVCEGFYFKKISKIGNVLNEVTGYLTDIFGEKMILKIQSLMGEEYFMVLSKIVRRMGFDLSVSGLDFVGGGLILAIVCAVTLLVLGVILEKNKTLVE